jgi:hypothetical protein
MTSGVPARWGPTLPRCCADDDSAEDTEDATLPAGSRRLMLGRCPTTPAPGVDDVRQREVERKPSCDEFVNIVANVTSAMPSRAKHLATWWTERPTKS